MIPLYLFVVISLFAAFLVLILGKIKEGLASLTAVIAACLLFVLSIYSVFWLKSGGVAMYPVGRWLPPVGIALVLDGMTVLMLVIVNLIGMLALIYSLSYIKKFTSPAYYYSLFMLMMAGLNGVVITGDLFNLYVFLEITAIASYGLVAFGTEAEELEAAFKYIVLGVFSSALIFLGIGIIFAKVSTLNMADIGMALAASPKGGGLIFATVLFIAGFGLKIALIPFHAWLPDAHPSAPAPVSAMLSGVVIKVLGVYSVCRIFFNIIGMTPSVSMIFMGLGIISMIAGALLAIKQTDMKRMLAYSSISQVGYVMIGISLGTPLGIMAGLFHLFNHSVFKSLLFLNSGAIEYSTGTRQMDKLWGLGPKMPVTAFTSTVGALSISGVPPFNGFWSKFFIVVALLQAGHIPLAITTILVSALTLAYFLKFQKLVFMRNEPGEDGLPLKGIKEVPFSMCFSMVALALICIFSGLLFAPLIKTLLDPAANVLVQGLNYAKIILGG